MELYVYDENKIVVAIVSGNNNATCERAALARFGDEYEWTYSPAFGSEFGLSENDDAEEISA